MSPRPSPVASPRASSPSALPHRRSSSCPRPSKKNSHSATTAAPLATACQEFTPNARSSRTTVAAASMTMRSSSQKPAPRTVLKYAIYSFLKHIFFIIVICRSTEVASVRKIKETLIPSSRAMQPIRARNLMTDPSTVTITHNTKDKLLLRATMRKGVVPR